MYKIFFKLCRAGLLLESGTTLRQYNKIGIESTYSFGIPSVSSTSDGTHRRYRVIKSHLHITDPVNRGPAMAHCSQLKLTALGIGKFSLSLTLLFFFFLPRIAYTRARVLSARYSDRQLEAESRGLKRVWRASIYQNRLRRKKKKKKGTLSSRLNQPSDPS